MSKQKSEKSFLILKRVSVGLIIVFSLAWTALNWSGLGEIKELLSGVAIVAFSLLVCEICFIAGLVLMLIGLGRTFTGLSEWIKEVRQVRKNIHLVAEKISASRTFKWGFNLNWFGAVGTGVVLFLGIVLVLPFTLWGFLVLPVLDIVASFGWRLPIDHKLRALKEAQ